MRNVLKYAWAYSDVWNFASDESVNAAESMLLCPVGPSCARAETAGLELRRSPQDASR